jgi:predicted phosphodiesterase
MRLAVLSDVHGNSIALDAVLADIGRRGGVDTYLFLGDHVAIGPDPIGVLERIARLRRARCVRGNTDRYILTGDRPVHTVGATTDDEKLRLRIELANSFSWTQGSITAAGWYDWIAALPFDLRLTLPDGTRVRAVHGTHRRDDENTLRPEASDAALTDLLAGVDAELVCAGHTHLALDRSLDRRLRLVNPGCVSNAIRSDGGLASYALVDAGADAYTVELLRVDYDHGAYEASLRQVHHPAAEYLIALHRRARTPVES